MNSTSINFYFRNRKSHFSLRIKLDFAVYKALKRGSYAGIKIEVSLLTFQCLSVAFENLVYGK